MGTKVSTLDGTWVVRRRWAPRILGRATPMERVRRFLPGERKRRRQEAGKPERSVTDNLDFTPDVSSGCLDVDELILFVLAVVALVLAVMFVVPLLVALGELLIVVVFALLGGVAKVVFRRPWTVEAISPHGERHDYRIVGWRRSGAAVDVIADRVTRELIAPAPAEVERQIERL